jgi:site-specific recombinase XerD
MIPIVDAAQSILDKYSYYQSANKGRLLPVLSNQKMNSYLKEISDLCGINKTLTTHTALHTFATSVALNNGMSLESVAGMLAYYNKTYKKICPCKGKTDCGKY